MYEKTVLILERSSQNLKKISKDGKVVLEGVFAEFGVENRNGRVYEEKEYMPHLEYLKKDIAAGTLLGELDHPEKFEVSLGNVSHRISDLWYDAAKRQVIGRIEILEGTPKGQIAKTLLEAGVPLSISSRAAGSVNEDKTVQIQQIYTYDLVAKPGFEAAQLHTVNESENPVKAKRIASLLEGMNASFNKHEKETINKELGVLNENISIIDVTDKFPATWNGKLGLREEAKLLIKNNNVKTMSETKTNLDESVIQNWTIQFNGALSKLNERLDTIESAIIENGGTVAGSDQLKDIKAYIEKLRKIQESTINWQSDIAKALNKVGRYADSLAESNNRHYKLTKKIVEAVDHNAKTLNATQDWVGNNAKVTNVIAETVDHNAVMTNKLNEWNTQISKAVNKLNEWGEEKAVAINGMHEWTSSIAKNFNHTASYTEDMFGRAVSKEDLKKVIEYTELIAESKQNKQLKNKIDEMLTKNTLTGKKLNEASLKPLSVLTADNIGKTSKVKDDGKAGISSDIEIDPKSKALVSKYKEVKFKPGTAGSSFKIKVPVHGDKTAAVGKEKQPSTLGNTGSGWNAKNVVAGTGKDFKSGNGPSGKLVKDQNLKLDQKPEGKLKEEIGITTSIKTRSSKLDEKLAKIVDNLEKERAVDESIKTQHPFTTLLSETDRKRFAALSASDKEKVAKNVQKNPTVESESILKLWENALTGQNLEEPKWLSLAPKDMKELFNKADNMIKENLKARAEFYELETQYQINNFWETSGLIVKPAVTLNEAVTIKSNKEIDPLLDPYMASIAEKLSSYNQI
jgi:hypothetical protein